MRSLTLPLGCLALSSVCLAQSASWVQVKPKNSPPGRVSQGTTYDIVRGRTIIFGGMDAGSVRLNDTWEYDGTNWTQMKPKTYPSPRLGAPLVYDHARAKTVMFGGHGSSTLGDTWTWDGQDWTKMTPKNSPPARLSHGMAYDSGRQRTVLFGGGYGGTAFGDTWEWDGTDWTQIKTTNSPSARNVHALAYDSARKRIVLFGGLDAVSVFLNDTWEYDGKDWIQMNPATKPLGRYAHAVAYDSVRQVTVLFGGTNNNGYLGDTWEYDGKDWTQMNPVTKPPGRVGHDNMVYDQRRKRMVLFGGLGFGSVRLADTWEYVAPQPLTASPSTISIANGGTQTLTLNAGGTHANRLYWMFGSMTGTKPGINLLGVHIPLNPDPYTDLVIGFANGKEFKDFKRTLSATGTATASLNVPAKLSIPIGFKLYHAYVVYDGTTGQIFTSSNPVSVEFK